MARGQDRRPDDEEEEKEDKDIGVSDEALDDPIDEDEDEGFGFGVESDDDKGWE